MKLKFSSLKTTKDFLVLTLSLFLKFTLFYCIWCSYTTFKPLSWIETYTNMGAITLLLMLPYRYFRIEKIYFMLFLLLDIVLVANLLYFRTYFTSIPPSNYLLLSNLADFTESIYSSFRWIDLCIPATTVAALIYYYRVVPKKTNLSTKRPVKGNSWQPVFIFLLLLPTGLSALTTRGGFPSAYEKLLRTNTYNSGVIKYTLFGNLFYQYLHEEALCTPETKEKVRQWIAGHQASDYARPETTPQNCIVILAESLESWVLEKEVEGKEITPCLNALLKEEDVLYAPNVLTQVRGGRSIDGQLLLLTGLLPIQNGTYSIRYPHSYYPSLPKAMKAQSVLMTGDSPQTWNQQIIGKTFGFDTLVYKPDYIQDEVVGNKRKMGDGTLLRQSFAKLTASRDLWNPEKRNFLLLVTTSGHDPFVLPESLKKIHFTKDIPQKLNDYMTSAHFTDSAIGAFISSLRNDPRFDNTLIVITGDHEGLADSRQALCNTPAGRNLVSPQQFTPFIVLHSPVSMRYHRVVGQVDMFPTLLDLLGIEDYDWKGLGSSILDPQRKGYAVAPDLSIKGDREAVPEKEIASAREAWNISDAAIRFDLLSPDSHP